MELQQILDSWWYYRIEYEKNKFTPGILSANRLLVRDAISRTDFKDKTVLDIGCMEGVFSVLAARGGAKSVMATDRYAFDDKINFVKSVYDVDFDYRGGIEFPELMDLCHGTNGKEAHAPFDIVNFSGILYHMYDFMNGFAMVRSLAKKGGIAIIETTGCISEGYEAHFNAHGNIEKGDPHNYFTLSVKLIDYLCRYFAMRPIDFCYLPNNSINYERFCFVCRIEDEPVEIESDPFLGRRMFIKDEKTGDFIDSQKRVGKQDDSLIFQKYPRSDQETFVHYNASVPEGKPLIFNDVITDATSLKVTKEREKKISLHLDDRV